MDVIASSVWPQSRSPHRTVQVRPVQSATAGPTMSSRRYGLPIPMTTVDLLVVPQVS
ncbi:hypothetical protein [Kibdelosporangium philippinense]|uniref:hypothetical protein n=1 Tax=Kibdelosporangium philippinense TaxID=211113 RepID=UPI00360AEC2F